MHLQSIDLKRDMRIADVMIENNKSAMTPWEVETIQLKGVMNASRLAMAAHRRTMSQVSPSDIKYLKSQHRAGEGAMPQAEREHWVAKLGGSLEEFNKIVPMLSR